MNIDTASLRRQWRSMQSEIRSGQPSKLRLLEILTLILYDGEDLCRRDLVGELDAGEGFLGASPVLTPIERLLLFIRQAVGQVEFDRMSARDTSRGKEVSIAAFRAYGTLRRLLHLTLGRAIPRVLSSLDRLRLVAEHSNIRYRWSLLHPDLLLRHSGRQSSRHDLERLEKELAALPGVGDVERRSLRILCRYRRAVHAVRSRPQRTDQAVCCLLDVLKSPSREVSDGLYFHAARHLFLLPEVRQRETLPKCRVPLGLAFATMPKARLLDRIGIAFVLAQDASLHSAPRTAANLLGVADRLLASDPEIERYDRTRKQIGAIRRKLSANEAECLANSNDPLGAWVARTGAAVQVSIGHALMVLREFQSEDEFPAPLYRIVAQSWIGRLVSSDRQPVWRAEFSDSCTTALDHCRDKEQILALARAGYVCRYLHASGVEEIDSAMVEFDNLLALSVLAGTWLDLVEQLKMQAHHRFLEKLGFERESQRLMDIAAYLQEVLPCEAEPDRVPDGTTRINLLLLGVKSVFAELRRTVDVIQDRWRDSTEAVGRRPDEWAKSYAVPTRRFQFTPANDTDPLVSQFFQDCATILECETKMLQAEDHMDEIPIWNAMAFSAYHFCRLLRAVQGPTPREKVQTARGKVDADWLQMGVSWADRAIALSRQKQRVASLYRSLDIRKRLEDRRNRDKDARLIQSLTDEMLAIDVRRLDTTIVPSRRNRAIIRSERTLCSNARRWAEWSRSYVPLGVDQVMDQRFGLVQRLKAFNYGQLVNPTNESQPVDQSRAAFADLAIEEIRTPDAIDQADSLSSELNSQRIHALQAHLSRNDAVILEFVTHPGDDRTDWKLADQRSWGTTCFVVKVKGGVLVVRPIYLPVPEALIQTAIDGTLERGRQWAGLQNDLVYWPERPDGRFPEALETLSSRLFPDELKAEIRGHRKIYLCPHRHLFQVPLHALPLEEPLFTAAEVSYCMKTAHLAGLAETSIKAESESRSRSLMPRWTLVDNAALGKAKDRLQLWIAETQHWGAAELGIEDLITGAAAAKQAVICCHGQIDEARPGRSRLRLWGGGRWLADDFRRAADTGFLDLRSSDWVIAACNAGHARVGFRTAPGFALSLVNAGAGRVTSCLYRVQPGAATRFLSSFLKAYDAGHAAPFTAAARGVYKAGGRSGWAEAASFVSYGLMSDPPISAGHSQAAEAGVDRAQEVDAGPH